MSLTCVLLLKTVSFGDSAAAWACTSEKVGTVGAMFERMTAGGRDRGGVVMGEGLPRWRACVGLG